MIAFLESTMESSLAEHVQRSVNELTNVGWNPDHETSEAR